MSRTTTRWLLVLLLSLLAAGCTSYSSKFRRVADKIRKHPHFQSLNAHMDYEIEPGQSEAIPYIAILMLKYADAETGEDQVYRVRYGYPQTFRDNNPREWNWVLANVERSLESGQWEQFPEILKQPTMLDMLRT
ncbi:MAG: hypothetical protein VB877_15085 [Pirellulaceae bacterium]